MIKYRKGKESSIAGRRFVRVEATDTETGATQSKDFCIRKDADSLEHDSYAQIKARLLAKGDNE